ncbi:hypothetical protein V5799_004237 [Amblyomma americanum]|uniref:Peptidase M14 domain-containing protein n=1 Tax=Amblyomma americanum TaxID=6943 RepID=A0AAQ4D6P1_AMBAM
MFSSMAHVLVLWGAAAAAVAGMEFRYHSLEEVNSYVHHVASEHASLVTLQYLGNTVKVVLTADVIFEASESFVVGDLSLVVRARRENTNGVSINRNFPGAFERVSPINRPPVEPETAALMRLLRAYPAVLTVLVFGGLRGVLYPYDDLPGIGAAFSRISGSLADYAYAYEGSLPLSVYIGCCKYDESRSLRGHFEHSKAPLLRLLRLADRGVRGTVTNRRGEPVAGALLAISNRTVGFRTNQFGEFWRMLLPGFYMLLVMDTKRSCLRVLIP